MSYNMMPPQAVIPPGQQIDPTADIVAKIQALLAGKPMVPPVPQGGTPMVPTPPVVSPPTLTPPVVTSPEDAVAAFMKANPYPTLKQSGTPINMPTPPPTRNVTPRDLPKEGKQAAWTALAGTILGALAGGGAGAVTGGASALGGARAGQEQVDQTRMQEEAQAQAAQQADYANKVALANHAQSEQDKQNTLNERQYGSDVGSWDAQQRIAAMSQAHREANQNRDDSNKTAADRRMDQKRAELAGLGTPEAQQNFVDSDPELKAALDPTWKPVAAQKLRASLSVPDQARAELEQLRRQGIDNPKTLEAANYWQSQFDPKAPPITTLRQGMTEGQRAEIARQTKHDADMAAAAKTRSDEMASYHNKVIQTRRDLYANGKIKPMTYEAMTATIARLQKNIPHSRIDPVFGEIGLTPDGEQDRDAILGMIADLRSRRDALFPQKKPTPKVPDISEMNLGAPAPYSFGQSLTQGAGSATPAQSPTQQPPVLMPNGTKPAQHRDVVTKAYASASQKTVPVIPKVAPKPTSGYGKKTGVKWDVVQ